MAKDNEIRTKLTKREINKSVDGLVDLLASALDELTPDGDARRRLASLFDLSEAQIRKMKYEQSGSLAAWLKTLVAYYNLKSDQIERYKNQLLRTNPVEDADKIWFSIKDKLKASSQDRKYLALVAYEAFRIKQQVEKGRK